MITFIIPCYNSEKIIIKNYYKLKNFIKKHKIKSKTIYINDGSDDSTLNELLKIQDKNVKIVNNKINLGKSMSIIQLLKKVTTNEVILIDCDLPYFKYLKSIIEKLLKNNLVIVNRKLEKSTNLDSNKNLYQIARNLISNFLGFLIEARLNLNVNGDTQAGLKAFKIDKKLKNKTFFSKYYFFDIELINYFRKERLKISLVPVKYKISNKSNIKFFSFNNFKIIFEFFKILIKLKVI